MTSRTDGKGAYRPQRLPQAAESALRKGTLRAALDVVLGVHQTNEAHPNEAHQLEEPKTPDARWEIAQRLRPLETNALAVWAESLGQLLDGLSFTRRWKEQGCVEGGEHQLYAENGFVYKRNNLYYHSSWLEYLHRLALHNWLFRETYLTFEGLMWVEGSLQPVVSQKIIEAVRGAERHEVEAEMLKRGFNRSKQDNYYNSTLGLLVEDLHDENVLVSPSGNLFIFDPVIYIVNPAMQP